MSSAEAVIKGSIGGYSEFYPEPASSMRVFLIADTHFNHDNIATYCQRPADFTDLIIKRWCDVVDDTDLVIHLGDVAIGDRRKVSDILHSLPGRKVLVRGNHDEAHSPTWWMRNGFDAVTDGMIFRRAWLTHRPSPVLLPGCDINIHGHWHNLWDGFNNGDGDYLIQPHQRLFAVEYTDYAPVEFGKFVNHPAKYKAVPPPEFISNPPASMAVWRLADGEIDIHYGS